MSHIGADWPEIRIGSLGTVVTGRTPPTERLEYFGNNFLFITPGDMRQGKYAHSTERRLSNEGAKLLGRIRIPANSVCVSCIGWQMGETIMTAVDSFTNQQINSIIPHCAIDPSFLYYSLRPRKQELLSVGSGTGVRTPIMNKSAFCNLKVKVPGLPEQQRISSILSEYDNLIAVNAKRIQLLKNSAKHLFEEWFVHFRAPGQEFTSPLGGPVNRIPTGWRVVSLSDILETIEAGSRPKGGIKEGQGDVPSIGAENINGLANHSFAKEKFIPRAFFESLKRGVVQHGDVLLYKDGAHIGRLAVARDGFPHAECAVNEHVFILRSRLPVTHGYLFFWLAQDSVQQKIKALNSNAAQPGLNQPAVLSVPFLFPDSDTLANFARHVDAKFAMMFGLAKANYHLAISRDLLLPRLLSGQLSMAAAQTPSLAVAAE